MSTVFSCMCFVLKPCWICLFILLFPVFACWVVIRIIYSRILLVVQLILFILSLLHACHTEGDLLHLSSKVIAIINLLYRSKLTFQCTLHLCYWYLDLKVSDWNLSTLHFDSSIVIYIENRFIRFTVCLRRWVQHGSEICNTRRQSFNPLLGLPASVRPPASHESGF